MCELNFKPLVEYKKLSQYCSRCGTKLHDDDTPKYHKVHNRKADMFYSQWDDTVYLNAIFAFDEYCKRYPFNANMIEDETEAILNHEAIHQALNHTAGWKAAKWFDKICPHWANKYWMDPP